MSGFHVPTVSLKVRELPASTLVPVTASLLDARVVESDVSLLYTDVPALTQRDDEPYSTLEAKVVDGRDAQDAQNTQMPPSSLLPRDADAPSTLQAMPTIHQRDSEGLTTLRAGPPLSQRDAASFNTLQPGTPLSASDLESHSTHLKRNTNPITLGTIPTLTQRSPDDIRLDSLQDSSVVTSHPTPSRTNTLTERNIISDAKSKINSASSHVASSISKTVHDVVGRYDWYDWHMLTTCQGFFQKDGTTIDDSKTVCSKPSLGKLSHSPSQNRRIWIGSE